MHHPLPFANLSLVWHKQQRGPVAVFNALYCNAANDNDAAANSGKIGAENHQAPSLDSTVVQAAIRLFAEYGLGSADHALGRAGDCFWAGDSLGHKWWMAVLYQLDHRLVSGEAFAPAAAYDGAVLRDVASFF